MAEQMDKEFILDLKKKHPGYTVVAYINTTAALKTVCDVCVTSSSALEIVRKIESKDIIFVPDINLGTYVAESLPEKNVLLLQGGCPVHAAVTAEEAQNAKKLHPEAELLVHPECIPAVAKQADYIGSTSGIMDYAVKSQKKEFIIGTESSIAEHLQYMCPEKKFYPLTKGFICKDMKATTLMDVLDCCKGTGGEEIILDDATIRDARRCIDAMIELGG